MQRKGELGGGRKRSRRGSPNLRRLSSYRLRIGRMGMAAPEDRGLISNININDIVLPRLPPPAAVPSLRTRAHLSRPGPVAPRNAPTLPARNAPLRLQTRGTFGGQTRWTSRNC